MFRFPSLQLPSFQNEPIAAVTGAGGSNEPHSERTCEFCACRLTARGEVLQMSDKARELRTLADRLDKEERAHAETRGQLAAAQETIAELRAAQAPAGKKGILDIDL